MSEQRAHPRYAIELDVELDLTSEGNRKIRGRTHDISRGGFCMLAAHGVPDVASGSPTAVRMALVFSETEFSEQLTLYGTVMWCTRLKEGTQLGVKFDPLSGQSQGYLDLFIKFLEEGLEDEPET